MKHNIHVPWKVIDFAIVTGDTAFSQAIESLLRAGYHVDIGIVGGHLTFTRVAAFRAWVEELKADAFQLPSR